MPDITLEGTYWFPKEMYVLSERAARHDRRGHQIEIRIHGFQYPHYPRLSCILSIIPVFAKKTWTSQDATPFPYQKIAIDNSGRRSDQSLSGTK